VSGTDILACPVKACVVSSGKVKVTGTPSGASTVMENTSPSIRQSTLTRPLTIGTVPLAQVSPWMTGRMLIASNPGFSGVTPRIVVGNSTSGTELQA